jgi:hypothetical protein
LLNGCSPLLAHDFRHNLYVAFVISRLVLVAGPSIALMNPKYFNTMLFFSFWVAIQFWSLTGFPHASLHDLHEAMSVLHFETDNLPLQYVHSKYKTDSDKQCFRKSLIWSILKNYKLIDCRWNSNNRLIFVYDNRWSEHH